MALGVKGFMFSTNQYSCPFCCLSRGSVVGCHWKACLLFCFCFILQFTSLQVLQKECQGRVLMSPCSLSFGAITWVSQEGFSWYSVYWCISPKRQKAKLSVGLLCTLSPCVLRGAPGEDLLVIMYVAWLLIIIWCYVVLYILDTVI